MIKNISNLGDAAVYCDFGLDISEKINLNVISYFNSLSKLVEEHKINGINNITPSYNKLIISFDLSITNYSKIRQIILDIRPDNEINNSHKKIKIPVCCDDEFGLDLSRLNRAVYKYLYFRKSWRLEYYWKYTSKNFWPIKFSRTSVN